MLAQAPRVRGLLLFLLQTGAYHGSRGAGRQVQDKYVGPKRSTGFRLVQSYLGQGWPDPRHTSRNEELAYEPPSSDSDCAGGDDESTFDHDDLSTGPQPCYLSDQYTE